MSEEFDWDDLEENAVIVPEVRQTAVYTNPKGDVVIRQRASSYEREDPFVYIPMDRIPELIRRLQELLNESEAPKE